MRNCSIIHPLHLELETAHCTFNRALFRVTIHHPKNEPVSHLNIFLTDHHIRSILQDSEVRSLVKHTMDFGVSFYDHYFFHS